MDKVVCVDCVAGSFVFCSREWRDRGRVRGRNKTTGCVGERKCESWGRGYGRYSSVFIYETEVKIQILCFLAVNCCVFKPVSLLELIME